MSRFRLKQPYNMAKPGDVIFITPGVASMLEARGIGVVLPEHAAIGEMQPVEVEPQAVEESIVSDPVAEVVAPQTHRKRRR